MKNGKNNKWVTIPAEMGICFPFLEDCRPILLDTIPSIVNYEDSVELEKERDLDEIRKIVVQKIPHLADGSFLLEPPEAAELHEGSVKMLHKNKNISVLTTYADVDAIVSKTASDTMSNNLEKMANNIYYNANTSSQFFGTNTGVQIDASLRNDISLMMILANKFSIFITNTINRLFANNNINFKYQILPISQHNYEDYLDNSLKLANSGYSFLLPSLALGFSQSDINNIKDLENIYLKMSEKLIPLQTSYTQSSDSNSGAPEKDIEDKSPTTITTEISRNKI